MWFKSKKAAAPLYKDETSRRSFATASGRPEGADKLKKLKAKDPKEEKGWLTRFFALGKRTSSRSRRGVPSGRRR